jgi:hyperosmotically inducible periplasmic protein
MRSVRQLFAVAATVFALAGAAHVHAAGDVPSAETTKETLAKVRKALAKLPYYGVFDFLAFKVESGVVTLQGYAHRPSLKREAESMVERAVKADVVNQIEVLPSSTFDDRIRWETYQRVYTEDLASRYVSGGETEVRYEVLDMQRFPGMEPYGTYPVHIIVKDRKLHLIGLLDNDLDKTQVLHRARQVLNTRGLEDAIAVRRPQP